jgi:hypothetical protein
MMDHGYQSQRHMLDAGRVALALRGLRTPAGHYPFVAPAVRRRQAHRTVRAVWTRWRGRSRTTLAYVITLGIAGWILLHLSLPAHLLAR